MGKIRFVTAVEFYAGGTLVCRLLSAGGRSMRLAWELRPLK